MTFSAGFRRWRTMGVERRARAGGRDSEPAKALGEKRQTSTLCFSRRSRWTHRSGTKSQPLRRKPVMGFLSLARNRVYQLSRSTVVASAESLRLKAEGEVPPAHQGWAQRARRMARQVVLPDSSTGE